jgi:hypothetical protein
MYRTDCEGTQYLYLCTKLTVEVRNFYVSLCTDLTVEVRNFYVSVYRTHCGGAQLI